MGLSKYFLCGINPKKKDKKRKKKPHREENDVEEENPESENIEIQDHPELQQPRVPEHTPQQRSVVGSQQPTQSNERNLEDEISNSEEQVSREESNHLEDNNRESRRSRLPDEEESRNREEGASPTSPPVNLTIINSYSDFRSYQNDNRIYNDNKSHYYFDECAINSLNIQSDKSDENNPRNNSSSHNPSAEERENNRNGRTQVESDQTNEVFSPSLQGECEDEDLASEGNDFVQMKDVNPNVSSILNKFKNDSTSKSTGKLFETSSIEYIDATDSDKESSLRSNSNRQTSSKKPFTKQTKPNVPSRKRFQSEQTQRHPLQQIESENSDYEFEKSTSYRRFKEAKKRSRSLPSKSRTRTSLRKERNSCSNEKSETIEMDFLSGNKSNTSQDCIDCNELTTKKEKTSL